MVEFTKDDIEWMITRISSANETIEGEWNETDEGLDEVLSLLRRKLYPLPTD